MVVIGLVFIFSYGTGEDQCEVDIKRWLLGFVIIESISILRKMVTLIINCFTRDPARNKMLGDAG